MNCNKVRSLVSAYVDGELPGVEMLAIRQHLSECSNCASEYESLLNLKRLFGRLQPKHPRSDLATKICHRLDEMSQPAHDRWLSIFAKYIQPFPSRIRLAAAALAVLSALLVIRVGGSSYSNILSPTSVISTVASARMQNQAGAFVPQTALGTSVIELHPARDNPWLSPMPASFVTQRDTFTVRTAGFYR